MCLQAQHRLQVLQNRHDSRLAGHYGVRKTTELVTRDYWWPQQWKYVKDFVNTCDIVHVLRPPATNLMAIYNPCLPHSTHGGLSPWILSLTSHSPMDSTPSW